MNSFDLTSLSSLPLLVGRPLTLSLLFGRKTKKWHSCPSSCRDYTGHHFRSLPPRVATPNSALRGTRAHLQGAPQSGTDCVINRGPDGQNLMLPPGPPHSERAARSSRSSTLRLRPRPPLSPLLFPPFSSHAKESLASRSLGEGGKSERRPDRAKAGRGQQPRSRSM